GRCRRRRGCGGGRLPVVLATAPGQNDKAEGERGEAAQGGPAVCEAHGRVPREIACVLDTQSLRVTPPSGLHPGAISFGAARRSRTGTHSASQYASRSDRTRPSLS